MWYKNLGFKVDRKLKEAMNEDNLEDIKRLLVPSNDPEKISLNSLLPEAIKLGKITFNHTDSLLEFYNLSDEEKKEGKVFFNNYLAESIDIILDLIDYLVHRGADVTAAIDPTEHQTHCLDGKPIEAGSFPNEKEYHNISTNLHMPLAVGKVNAEVIGEISFRWKYKLPKRCYLSNHVKSAQRDLMRNISEQNDNMQIKLTQKLLDKGVDLDTTCISEKGHEIGFLGFIHDRADCRYTNQMRTFKAFYELQKSKDPKQILDAIKFIYTQAFPPDSFRKPCSALEDLIRKKLSIEVGKKLAFDVTKASDDPIGYAAAFLDLKEQFYVATLTKQMYNDLPMERMGEASENANSSIFDAS
ncbi:hypothetical protein phytr_3230 [Candidatus Phycorickettsia trachydisci]|uniref:Uncharacterized protein n=1 Tax=Candidatus Phycorickettsia trachydisci TaxID=2115978 RepID=A0A2P1P7M7_9RICK|nr:hypothetical protein [Candidatus Phycorickettsia trachydisci]AVP87277.1 hypothetical protein phytr_3230 [Candidatus Phycorickettsia trachydisci]